MSIRLRKTLMSVLFGTLLAGNLLPVQADTQDRLPDIGTTAGGTLSINQELAMGDFYVRQLRAGAPLINDPLLSNYINQLGNRLVKQADSVRTPFHFYLIRNDDINAFAFFGGNVVLHSALFRYADSESELASVLAHEISHVTQRHLARSMESQQRSAPLTWVGALGSILLAMANPQLGMAALSGTLAGAQQGMITFTQSNEQEADRIGIQVLQRAGFDPQAMPNFLQKLADQSRYASRPPEMLLTHPLPESRLSDARNRANQMRSTPVQSSQDFLFAKIRTFGMYGSPDRPLNDDLLVQWEKGNVREQLAAKYGRAIQLYQAKKYDDARNVLQPLLSSAPENPWFLDMMTDIDLGQNRATQAIARLQNVSGMQANPVLQLNLANAYVEGKQPAAAGKILYRYTYAHPDDPNGWELLAQAAAAQGQRAEELAARAESLALNGQLDQSIRLLSNASSLVKLGSLEQARYDARIDQFRQLQQRFRQYQKS
ncbi:MULTISPECIES: M48 family metallopeptidase [Pectobacterium]|uniref:Beta-barrel assembly-enhancing protease n=1 Tax=Pectobacterium punjabense TaxID=2108399 RepID=A0ABX6KZQ5_9GAMM|nr:MULTISPECIES: M48 family metallopeptidase [Pectobacterium]GKW12245.1 beta-barrel assembly-enhancing protease [Pectobacterium carotovorum subsp. carotovorum]MBN3136521.1 M48 family metallopeptidase [Pectobacterium punjabense]MBS4432147.1 M48 family metallopeptidase [Pectobacterium punjabense]MBT9186405.1 M48 family metallopeptidase [Pectobacterium punjabense]MCE5381293.1 M48 family metallopeptidase [Pectobacterium punjabense]